MTSSGRENRDHDSIALAPVEINAAGARRLLALDAAGHACSAAVLHDGVILASRFEARSRGHAERMVPLVEDVMQEAGLDYAELDAIAVTVGPGGFTGVRIGLSTARALGLAAERPVIGVSNFDVLEQAVHRLVRDGDRDLARQLHDMPLLIAIDSRRDEVYATIKGQDDSLVLAPGMMAPVDLLDHLPDGPFLLAGDGAALLQKDWPVEVCDRMSQVEQVTLADACDLARVAARQPLPSEEAAVPGPLYLRLPDVSVSKKQPLDVIDRS